MDPAERERCDVMQWLNQCIDTLNIQVARTAGINQEMEVLENGRN